MKNSDLKKQKKKKKKKKKGLKMHIKTKETFPNMLRNCFTFFTFIKNGVEVRFEPTPILTMQSNDLTLYQLS